MRLSVSFRWGEAALLLVLALLGLYAVWQGQEMPLGSLALPGPGFFPTILGLLLIVCSLLYLFLRFRSAGDGEEVNLQHAKVWITVAALIGVAFLFERLGALPALGLLLFGLIWMFSGIRWWRAALAAAFGVAVTWLIFVYLLGVVLPGV